MGVLPSQLHAAMPQLCRRRLCHDQGLLLPPQSLAHNSATSFWFSLESCYPHQVTAVKVTMNPRCGTIVDFDLPMQSTFRSAGQGFADWPDWHNPAKSSEDWHLEIAELRLSGCAFTIASFWWNRITFLPPSSMDQDSGSRSVNDWAGIWNIPAHWKKHSKGHRWLNAVHLQRHEKWRLFWMVIFFRSVELKVAEAFMRVFDVSMELHYSLRQSGAFRFWCRWEHCYSYIHFFEPLIPIQHGGTCNQEPKPPGCPNRGPDMSRWDREVLSIMRVIWWSAVCFFHDVRSAVTQV